MFDLEKVLRKQLRDRMRTRMTLIFPEGEDPRILHAASKLLKFCNAVLVGERARAEAMIDAGEVELDCSPKRFFAMVRFVDPRTDSLTAVFGQRLHEVSLGRKWEMTAEQAAEHAEDPVFYAIMAVREGYADAVLGGVAHASRDFFAPCLRILEKEGTVYEMALFALPDTHPAGIFEENLVMFSDVALNTIPTPESLAEVAVGACRTMRDLIPRSVLPEINGAILSYSTRGSGQGPSVERIRGAEPLIRARLAELRAQDELYESVHIVPEMQISVALSEDAARTKLKDDFEKLTGAGKAHVLIAPNLDVGNLLYHLYATRYPDAQSTLVIGGMHDQALDFSRSSTADEIARGAKALLLRRCRSGKERPTPHDDFFPRFRVLAINPGSTSTKVGLFEGLESRGRKEARHGADELQACARLVDQLPLRRATVEAFLSENDVSLADLDAVVGRGGLLRPIESGTYTIDERVLADLREGVGGEHPSNLGGLMAHELAAEAGVPAYIVDPPVVDELEDTARITGFAGVEARAAWHALSQKGAAKVFAASRNKEYEELNLIVAHVGGGVSVGAHRLGRCIRVKNALLDGPMSANRGGTLPTEALIEMCYSGIPREELERTLMTRGGLISYLGTSDLREVEQRIDEGDAQAALVFAALASQVAAEVAALVPAFQGERIDRIILTGGMLHSRRLRQRLRHDLRALNVKQTIYPGEREMEALRDGALRVLRGIEEARTYAPAD